MAIVTQENIGLLHEKLTVKLEKADYLPSFEKALKDYSKKADMPGFRKGMVPAGLIKKMYGPSLFTDEVLRSVNRELINYLQNLEIFGQPLPLEADVHQLDVNNPADYTFHFEVGMKPEFELPDLSKENITEYKVKVTDEMINDEITRLQNRYGNVKDEDTVNSEENLLNVIFTEADENGREIENGIKKESSVVVKYFREDFRVNIIGKVRNDYVIVQMDQAFEEKELAFLMGDLGLDPTKADAAKKHFRIQITKIGLLEKKELNEEFFDELYPNQDIKSESDFRNKIKEEIEAHWKSQSRNQVQDQIFHRLVDHTQITFPEGFLKKWLKTRNAEGEENESPLPDEKVEEALPGFLKQLKWILITDKIIRDNGIEVTREEMRNFARQQLLGYLGNAGTNAEDQPWVSNYIDKIMNDPKYAADAHDRLRTQKIFEWAAAQARPVEQEISSEEFTEMVEEHNHHHHH